MTTLDTDVLVLGAGGIGIALRAQSSPGAASAPGAMVAPSASAPSPPSEKEAAPAASAAASSAAPAAASASEPAKTKTSRPAVKAPPAIPIEDLKAAPATPPRKAAGPMETNL